MRAAVDRPCASFAPQLPDGGLKRMKSRPVIDTSLPTSLSSRLALARLCSAVPQTYCRSLVVCDQAVIATALFRTSDKPRQ